MCVVFPRGVNPSPFALKSSVLRVSVRVPVAREERSVQVELVAVFTKPPSLSQVICQFFSNGEFVLRAYMGNMNT